MHVSLQLRDSLLVRLGAIPLLDGRAFPRGAPGWDRRTYPIAVVNVGASTVVTELSGARLVDRLQTRTQAIVVELHDLDEGDDDVEPRPDRLSELAVAVEVAMSTAVSQPTVPIDDLLLTADTGVAELQSDEEGLHLAQLMTFSASYYTREGRPDVMLAPND